MNDRSNTIKARLLRLFGHGSRPLNQDSKNKFDEPTAVLAAILLGIAGTGVAMGMPLFVGSLAESLGFNEQQLGWIASADMTGLFIGSTVTAMLVEKTNRQRLAYVGLTLLIISNALSIQNQALMPLLMSRLVAGIGAGICYSTCTASLAGSRNTAWAYSLLLFVLVSMNAFIFFIFPIIDAQWGINGIFGFYLLEALPILLVVPLIPRYFEPAKQAHAEDTTDANSPVIPAALPRLCLASVFTFYIMVGAYWAFIERAGVDANISPELISDTLVWAQICSLSAAVFTVWLARHFGQSKPLIFALLLMSLSMLVMAQRIDQTTFIFSVFSFSFLWIFVDVFQLGTLSNIDHSGRYAALVPALQGVAQAIAPTIAGTILLYGEGYSSVMILCAIATAVALLIFTNVYRKLIQVAPSLANAQ